MDEFWDLLIRCESRLDNLLNIVRPMRVSTNVEDVSGEDKHALVLHLERLRKYVARLEEILDV